MYPRLIFDLTKRRQNLDAVSKVTHESGCSMMIMRTLREKGCD